MVEGRVVAVTDGPAVLHRIEPHLGWVDRAGEKADLLRQILSSATDPNVPGAIIPFVEGQSLRFLACAGTPSEWERLRPLLLAYVGVTLSDFDGSPRPPHPGDEVAKLLRDSGVEVIAEIIPRHEAGRQCVDALSSLTSTLAAAPPEAEFAPKSTTQLLAAFRMAAAAEDRLSAEASIAALRAEMRLDALNLAFLEVQLDAALGDWLRLRRRWFFEQLCSSRRPPRVTAALAEALYWCEIAPLEVGLDGSKLVALFQERCLTQFGRLFTVAPSNPSTAVVLTFLLAAASGAVPNRAMALSLLRDAPRAGVDEKAVRAMAARLFGDDILVEGAGTTGAVDNPLEKALLAVEPDSPATLEQLRAALRAGYALQSISSATRVVETVRSLNPDQRKALLADRATAVIWEELLGIAGGETAPTDWISFLAAALEMPYDSARQWAEAATIEIPIALQLSTPDRTIEFITALQRWFSRSEVTFYPVLPHLLEWIKGDPAWPISSYRDLYLEILELLIIGSGRASEAVSAVGLLLGGLLRVGLTGSQYTDVLGELADWTGTAVAPRDLDPVIDLADIAANNPCPDTDVRDRFWSSLLAAISPHSGRLTSIQIAALQDLALALGAAEWVAGLGQPQPEPGSGQVPGLPPGYQIAIYTLVESAGRRIRAALQAVHPKAQIDLFTDHVATPRLVEAASRADMFVICWAAAKHSATRAISDNRASRLPTVYPRGVGSASVLREIEEQIATLQQGRKASA